MSPNLVLALEITAIGMGLVFAAILLLWGVMALLVRVAKDPPEEPEAGEAETAESAGTLSGARAVFATAQSKGAVADPKHLAAAIAVAYALAQQSDTYQPHEFPLPPTAIVSAWQAIMRTRMLNKRGSTR